MKLCFPKETHPGENRVAATPASVKKLVKLGFDVAVQRWAGDGSGYPDGDYEAAGAQIVAGREELFRMADALACVRHTPAEDLGLLREWLCT